jgi:hypothetical protein
MALYSNYEYVIRQSLSRMMNDCVLCTASAGAKSTYTIATANPPQFYNLADDQFNEEQWEAYCYSGTNIGTTQLANDWVNDTRVLTLIPDAAAAYDTSSKLELHNTFYVVELRDAINRAIDLYAKKYLVDLEDSTTITLTRTERNDVSDSYINTYEYALPTDALYIHRVTTEDSVSGVKLTGTVSAAFTLGEKVTGDSSGATGLVSYSGSTYIRLREVSGTFTTSDTATGGTSEQTCSSITAVEYETAGNGKFPMGNIVSKEDRTILKAYEPKIKFDERHYDIVEDLRIKLEYQGSQAAVTADTDIIFLPPHEFIEVAATFLPFSKIESNNLTAVFNKCLQTRDRVMARPPVHPYANSKSVIE